MMTKDDIIKEAKALCNKFVNKVETGRARSKETYNDCLSLLRSIEKVEKIDTKELEKAEQQIFGFYSAKEGETLKGLINGMGLTFNEYTEMKKQGMLSYLPDEIIQEIEKILF